MTRPPKTETKTYFLLRWRSKDGKVLYAKNAAYQYAHYREWYTTEKVSEAYHFGIMGDAERTAKTKAFEDLRDGERRYHWEVVRITETVATHYEEQIEGSSAPAMVQ